MLAKRFMLFVILNFILVDKICDKILKKPLTKKMPLTKTSNIMLTLL